MEKNLIIAMSELKDGSMSKAVDDNERQANRGRFLRSNNIAVDQATLVHLKYEGNDYCRYYTVSSENAGEGMVLDSTLVSDALFTCDKNLALFLPVADCIGAVLYDPSKQVLGLAHFGRHNLVQHGGTKVIDYMGQKFGSEPSDTEVWLSPAAGRENYPLYEFNNRSLHDVAIEQLHAAGISSNCLSVDHRDTTMDHSLFSHSEFLEGRREADGRQAVVAMMRP